MPDSDLKALAEAKFGNETLSDAEKLLLENIPKGKWAKCDPKHDDADPREADTWGPTRRIRAELVGWLCMDRDAQKCVHWRGVQVYGADITGPLDLSFVSIPFQLAFEHCRLKDAINLGSAEVSELNLTGSLVHGISANGVIVKNDVLFSDGFAAVGQVSLIGAQIGGDLDCSDGSFTNLPQKDLPENGEALDADGINVKGSVFLNGRFTANGRVWLLGAQIGGDLDCSGGAFTNPPQKDVKGSVEALNAERINVKKSVLLKGRFTASGEVQLIGAQIGGDLDCSDGSFTNLPQKDLPENGEALDADGINVKGSVFLNGRFTANGRVWLLGAQIGGDLDCSGGAFTNPPQKDVKGSGEALNAERINVKRDIFMTDGFRANGELGLENAEIGGPFICRDGNFQKAILNLTDASAGTLVDSGLNDPVDPQPTLWPQPSKLLLDGFTYGRIASPGRINVDRRLGWLALQPQSPFHPGPYLQLAKVLRESGDDKGSKRVLIEMEDRLRKGDTFGPVMRPLLRLTVGYGYAPLRAFWWATGLSALGWIIYRRSYLAGGMVPTDKEACAEFRKAERELPAQYPSFSPLIYSVENSLPLVKLGQEDKWQPDPEPDPEKNQSGPRIGHRGKWQWRWRKPERLSVESDGETGGHYASPNLQTEGVATQGAGSVSGGAGAAAAAAPGRAPELELSPRKRSSRIERVLIAIGLRPATDPKHVPSFLNRFATSPRFVLWFLWIQILLGWLLATLFVAGISGIVHKQ